jgi:hypothetical protein
VSIALLAWMFWLSLDRGRPESTVSSTSTNLAASLAQWSRRGIAPDNVVAQLDRTPSPAERDWLADLRGAGSKVTWTGNLPAAAIGVQPVASPRGGLRILAASPNGKTIQLGDEIGSLDTAIAENGGAAFTIASASGKITASVGGTSAHAMVPDSVQVKRVLVIGSAGWETKFVVAALEEDGWKVDADIRVAPSVDVTQGALTSLDTARYSAVVALDNTASARAPEITRFAVSGGGVILAGSSAANDAFAALRSGSPGKVQSIAAGAEPGAITLASLSYAPISTRSDAIAIDRKGDATVTAARRSGAGRVMQIGYLDTWRWRMSGGDTSPSEHRAWWSDAVANVAYVAHGADSAPGIDNAPVADLIGLLGPASAGQHADLAPASMSISLWWLFALLSLSLLAEWASRRLRGSR